MTPEEAREILSDAKQHRALNAWERNFVASITRFDNLSEAQIGVIRNIERKIYQTG